MSTSTSRVPAIVVPPRNDLSLQDIEVLTVEMVTTVITMADKKISKKAETRKKIVDAAMKGLGKVVGKTLEELAKSSSFHPEILGPLSLVSDVAVEELGKAFAESILTLSDSTNNKLNQLLNNSLKTGFETALIFLNVKPANDADRYVHFAQLPNALHELSQAANMERNRGEMLAVRWMQAILCLKVGAQANAKEYLKLCLPTMQSMQQEAVTLMNENKDSADQDQLILDMYRNDPNSVLLEWPTMDADANGFSESALEYNKRCPDGKPAMEDPALLESFIHQARVAEDRHARLVRAIDYFAAFAIS
jgi:hypothetical protein